VRSVLHLRPQVRQFACAVLHILFVLQAACVRCGLTLTAASCCHVHVPAPMPALIRANMRTMAAVVLLARYNAPAAVATANSYAAAVLLPVLSTFCLSYKLLVLESCCACGIFAVLL
jgi:VIT1/CCC1 family predicted Fe2+/Mn2+ transporter